MPGTAGADDFNAGSDEEDEKVVDELTKEERIKRAQTISQTRILTQADFERIKVLQMERKLMPAAGIKRQRLQEQMREERLEVASLSAVSKFTTPTIRPKSFSNRLACFETVCISRSSILISLTNFPFSHRDITHGIPFSSKPQSSTSVRDECRRALSSSKAPRRFCDRFRCSRSSSSNKIRVSLKIVPSLPRTR